MCVGVGKTVLDRVGLVFFQQLGVDAKDRRTEVVMTVVEVVVRGKQRRAKNGSLTPGVPFLKGARAAFKTCSSPRAGQCI